MVMPSNNGHHKVHFWQGKYGGLGHLYSPGGERGPFDHLPYALDNGAYPAWEKGTAWDEDAFLRLLDWACETDHHPMWVAAPDVVTDAAATLDRWGFWSEEIRERGFQAALVVQDGMTPADVEREAPDVVFVGGSTDWKWLWLYRFCASHPRVHVGRVNGARGLQLCWDAGAESCDGTGWFRGDKAQLAGLESFLREQADGRLDRDVSMFS